MAPSALTLQALAVRRQWPARRRRLLRAATVAGLFRQSVPRCLSQNAAPGPNLWTPLALLAGMGVVGGAIIVVGAAAEQTLQHVLSTLMRRNALEHILRQPGAQPLPASSGEAIA